MEIFFTTTSISNSDFEIVERKGIGHPDTLSDMIAEEFSNQYSCYCIEHFGSVLNHWSDKVVLSGGVAELDWGTSKIKKPVAVYLFGKAVESVGDEKIPIRNLFIAATEKVIRQVFANDDFLSQINYVIDINNGIGKEHLSTFYTPQATQEVKSVETYKSNDTVICSGFAPYSTTERIAIDLENYINGDFKNKFPFTGTDVKVVVIRRENLFDVTVCIPFIAAETPNFEFYRTQKESMINDTLSYLYSLNTQKNTQFKVSLNTKDFGAQGYLVAYSSALDKGDFGAVGRGNKYSGVISLNRKTNIEAVSGKNPQNHSGKLYTIFAHRLAWKIYMHTNIPVSIDVVARNGEPIDTPAYVVVDVVGVVDKIAKEQIAGMVREEVTYIPTYIGSIISRDVVSDHKERQFIYD